MRLFIESPLEPAACISRQLLSHQTVPALPPETTLRFLALLGQCHHLDESHISVRDAERFYLGVMTGADELGLLRAEGPESARL